MSMEERKTFLGGDSFARSRVPVQRLLSMTPQQHISATQTAVSAGELLKGIQCRSSPCGGKFRTGVTSPKRHRLWPRTLLHGDESVVIDFWVNIPRDYTSPGPLFPAVFRSVAAVAFSLRLQPGVGGENTMHQP